jgi:hypothetical protein
MCPEQFDPPVANLPAEKVAADQGAHVQLGVSFASAGLARSRPGAVIWLDAMASLYFGLGLDRGSGQSWLSFSFYVM